MRLAFGGSGSDGGPADQVGDVLGRNRVEQLGSGRQAEIQDIAEKSTGELKTVVNIARIVEVRIHDQAFPADRCSRFLEIDTHDEKEAIGYLASEIGQAPCVFTTGFDIVDRAGTDYD